MGDMPAATTNEATELELVHDSFANESGPVQPVISI